MVWKPAGSGAGSAINSLMVEIPPEYSQLADSWIQVGNFEGHLKFFCENSVRPWDF